MIRVLTQPGHGHVPAYQGRRRGLGGRVEEPSSDCFSQRSLTLSPLALPPLLHGSRSIVIHIVF